MEKVINVFKKFLWIIIISKKGYNMDVYVYQKCINHNGDLELAKKMIGGVTKMWC